MRRGKPGQPSCRSRRENWRDCNLLEPKADRDQDAKRSKELVVFLGRSGIQTPGPLLELRGEPRQRLMRGKVRM